MKRDREDWHVFGWEKKRFETFENFLNFKAGFYGCMNYEVIN